MSIRVTNNTEHEDQAHINITLLFHSDNSQRSFSVSTELRTGEFLEQVLRELAQGENAARLEQLRNNYEPVLELLVDETTVELESTQTLAEAGISNNAICQIAARPLKEKLMFCRYASQA